MRVRAPLWILGFIFLATAARASVEIDAWPCFAGEVASGGVVPFVLTVRNNGPSVSGAAVVEAGPPTAARSYVYPLSLPTGTVKRVMLYPRKTYNGDDLRLHFSGGIRAKDVNLESALRYSDARLVGFIGDRIGAISAVRKVVQRYSAAGLPGGPPGMMRSRRELPVSHFTDIYAKPEDAPDRAIGYDGISKLVLGDGCERLSPGQWTAIRQWVLGGGSLIVLGGPGATFVKLPDIQPVLPVKDLQSRSLGSITSGVPYGPGMPKGPYAVTTGTPVAGSEILDRAGDLPVIVSRPYGGGCVAFAAFSPLELPLRGSSVVPRIWGVLLRSAGSISSISRWYTSVDDSGGTPTGMPGTVETRANPFRIQLPPIETVLAVFVCYFILVVPVTYIVLKRRQRLEWAWITSPILSIVCAYVFYLFTASLYQAGMSRRTSGLLVAAAGRPDGRFTGYTELFIPRGGSYRLDVEGLDSLEATSNSQNYYYSEYAGQPLETVDAGTIFAPQLEVGNLAFKRVYHTQFVAMKQGITANLRTDPNGGFSGTVTNNSGIPLTNAIVVWPRKRLFTAPVSVADGYTENVQARDTWNTASKAELGPSQPRAGAFTTFSHENLPAAYGTLRGFANARHSGAFLFAQTTGEALGPHLGKYVGTRGTVTVIVSLPDPVGRY